MYSINTQGEHMGTRVSWQLHSERARRFYFLCDQAEAASPRCPRCLAPWPLSSQHKPSRQKCFSTTWNRVGLDDAQAGLVGRPEGL